MPDFREDPKYLQQIRNMLEGSTIETVSPEIGTWKYVCDKYEGTYLRLLDRNENKVHIIDKGLFEKRLRYYDFQFEDIFAEVERINWTFWF